MHYCGDYGDETFSLSLYLALLVSSFFLSFSISFSRVVYQIVEVTKYDRVLAQCDRPAKRRRVNYMTTHDMAPYALRTVREYAMNTLYYPGPKLSFGPFVMLRQS